MGVMFVESGFPGSLRDWCEQDSLGKFAASVRRRNFDRLFCLSGLDCAGNRLADSPVSTRF